MIDLKLLREDPDRVRASQRSRGEDPGLVDALLDADAARRAAISEADTARANQKAASKLKYNVKNTAGPTTFPKDRVQPGVCGTLVTSNGTGYDVTVPYFCGEAVKSTK